MTPHVARFFAPHFLQHGSRQMCPTYAYETLMPLTGRELLNLPSLGGEGRRDKQFCSEVFVATAWWGSS